MIDTLPQDIAPSFAVPLNEYNVHHLQFALQQEAKTTHPEPLPLDARLLPSSLDIDYDSRRMSSSATSDSSLHSRPDKRPATPDRSPLPKRARPGQDSPWSDHDPADIPSSAADLDPTRVQLPSLASAFTDRHELRRASLPTLYPDPAARARLPYPIQNRQPSSGLPSYQFPPLDADGSEKPSRLDTQLGYPGPVSDLSALTSATTSATGSSFGVSPLSAGFPAPSRSPSGISDPESWASTSIARPNSTPGDSLRHSIGGPESMFGGVQRIAGHDRPPIPRLAAQSGNGLSSIKTEHDWSFPSAPDYNMSPSTSASGLASSASAASNPSISVTNSPSRSPQSAPNVPTPSVLDRAPPQQQRKRGKLPKPVTDFLKDWLHRHSDHPYPSEEEKKQLCHATGLSMSQVSNWMINARRRILAPARHSTAGPTTTTPFATRPASVGMGMGMPGMPGMGPLDPGRRMSVDSLQLYYPMSLQSLGHDPHHLSPTSTRHMVGMARSVSSGHATAGSLSGLGHHGHGHSPYALSEGSYTRVAYHGGSGGAPLHPSAHSQPGGGASSFFSNSSSGAFLGPQGSMYSQGAGYAQSGGHHAPQGGSPSGRVLTPGADEGVQGGYRFPEHSASPGPQTGSGYATPQ